MKKLCRYCKRPVAEGKLDCASCLNARGLRDLLDQQRIYADSIRSNALALKVAVPKGGVNHVLLVRSNRRTFCGMDIEHYRCKVLRLRELPQGVCPTCLSQLHLVLAEVDDAKEDFEPAVGSGEQGLL